jgi:hypothetical protein
MNNPFSTESLLKKSSNFPVAKGGEGSGRHPEPINDLQPYEIVTDDKGKQTLGEWELSDIGLVFNSDVVGGLVRSQTLYEPEEYAEGNREMQFDEDPDGFIEDATGKDLGNCTCRECGVESPVADFKYLEAAVNYGLDSPVNGMCPKCGQTTPVMNVGQALQSLDGEQLSEKNQSLLDSYDPYDDFDPPYDDGDY